MPHQDKSQKCYLDLGINLEWPNQEYASFCDSGLKKALKKRSPKKMMQKMKKGVGKRFR